MTSSSPQQTSAPRGLSKIVTRRGMTSKEVFYFAVCAFQNVSNLPSVKRDRRELASVEKLSQSSLIASRLQRTAASRVPDRRHLLSSGQ